MSDFMPYALTALSYAPVVLGWTAAFLIGGYFAVRVLEKVADAAIAALESLGGTFL